MIATCARGQRAGRIRLARLRRGTVARMLPRLKKHLAWLDKVSGPGQFLLWEIPRYTLSAARFVQPTTRVSEGLFTERLVPQPMLV